MASLSRLMGLGQQARELQSGDRIGSRSPAFEGGARPAPGAEARGGDAAAAETISTLRKELSRLSLRLKSLEAEGSRSQAALDHERSKRSSAETALQELNERHTAMLGRMDVLKRTVEALQFDKEMQVGTAEKVQQLANLERDVRASVQLLLTELTACRDVVHAERESAQHSAEVVARAEQGRKELAEKLSQSESESRDLKRQLGITKTQYNSRMLDDRTAQLETALGRQKSLERQLAEEQASSKRQAAEYQSKLRAMERNPPTAGAGAPVSQTQPENAHDEDESDYESSSYISDIYEDISQADKNEEEEEEEQMSAGAGDAHEDETDSKQQSTGHAPEQQAAAPHQSTHQDVMEAEGATECRSVGDEDEDMSEEEDDLEDGTFSALSKECKGAALDVFDQDEDDGANLGTNPGIEDSSQPVPADVGEMGFEEEDGAVEGQAQQTADAQDADVADEDAAVDESPKHSRAKKATRKRGGDRGEDREEAVLAAGGEGGVAEGSPPRTRRAQPTVTKRWSSRLGMFVGEDGEQGGMPTAKETEGTGGKRMPTIISDPGGRSRRGAAAAAPSQSDAQAKRSKQAESEGASEATKGDIQKPPSTRPSSKGKGARVKQEKADEEKEAGAAVSYMSKRIADGSGGVLVSGSRQSRGKVMRWSSTLGREVPVEMSSPPKKFSPSKSPSPAKMSPRASKSPPVRAGGVAARGAARSGRGGSRRGGRSGAIASATGEQEKPVAVNVKVEEAVAVNEVEDEDGEVVMRHRASLGGGSPRLPMVEVSEDEDQAQARGRRSRKPKTAKKWSSTLGDWVDQEEPVDAKRSGGSRVRSRSAVADAPEDAAEGRSRRSVRGRGKAGSEGAGDSRSKSAGKEAMVEDGNDEDGGAVSKKRRLESATGAGSQGVNAKRQAVEDAGEGGSSAPVEVKKEAAEEGMGWMGWSSLSFSKFMRS